ncbi:MAG: hypothetical protein HFG80_12750 [Eubacterium sp.]|nr:hypothetical protein [Eubacterium sp.]
MEKELFAQRTERVKKAIALETPDRVPFVPTLGNVIALEYGVSIKDAMTDARTLIPALDKMLETFQPDYFYSPDFFPKTGMDILQPVNINYPGKTPEFSDNFTYQTIDHEFMGDDEYEEFLKDPSAYLIHKVMSEKFRALTGLKFFNPYSLCGSTVMGFAALAAPPMQQALLALIDAGNAVSSYNVTLAETNMHLAKKGFPVWESAVASHPFDDFADNIRGLLNTVMDLKTDPELLAEAVDRYTDVSIESAIGLCKMLHTDNIFIPLHIGVDEFMSPEDYNQYYWPPLKKMICALIQAEITPFVFCEGNYHTRLETIRNVPKGKVVYFFEKQDMANAKKCLAIPLEREKY